MNTTEDDDSNPSTPSADSAFFNDDRLDKIMDWLQGNGVKEGAPTSIQETIEDRKKERVLLK